MTGHENARFGLRVMQQEGLSNNIVTAIAHATSLRRLSETLRHESQGSVAKLFRVPTAYPFDENSPHDQKEAIEELLRLADWPGRGWLPQQDDLPQNLVDFAKDSGIATPKKPSSLITSILRSTPHKIRQKIIEAA